MFDGEVILVPEVHGGSIGMLATLFNGLPVSDQAAALREG